MTKDEARKRYDAIRDKLAVLASEMEELASDAQSDYDDRSEAWQDGERGQAWLEMVDDIGNAADALQEASDLELPS